MDGVVGGRFKIGSKIGSGTFGEVFRGFDIQSGVEVAIKLEPVKSEHPTLPHEVEIYNILQGEEARLPSFRWFGVEGEYNAMVLDRLGPSLEDLFNYCGRKFSLKTVLMLADQLIDIVMYMHESGVVHRDIKPENLLMGLGSKSNQVYAIDFGLAGLYRDVETKEHIRYRSDRHFTGSHRYAAIRTHYGCERSRRDDLESLGYVLMYFLKGSLPWQGLSEIEDKRWKNTIILETKCYAPNDKEHWESFPLEFTEYIAYCRYLPFKETPDYCYLKNLFRDLFIREGYRVDYVFDWTLMDGSLQKQEESRHIDPENLQRIQQWRI